MKPPEPHPLPPSDMERQSLCFESLPDDCVFNVSLKGAERQEEHYASSQVFHIIWRLEYRIDASSYFTETEHITEFQF